MMYLKFYEDFNSNDVNSDIDSICEKYGITNYTINDDGTIDVDGRVDLLSKGLTKLPLKFRNVSGNFYCSHNQLTTLEGCPHSVGDYFYCNDNKLTSLEGGPESVRSNFYCNNNELTSLKFAPRRVGGDFACSYNNIKELDDMYQYTTIVGNFYCDGNPIHEVWWLFLDKDAIELLIDYDIFRNDGESIVLIRLNAFLEHIGKPTVQSVKGYKII